MNMKTLLIVFVSKLIRTKKDRFAAKELRGKRFLKPLNMLPPWNENISRVKKARSAATMTGNNKQ